jgi:hypothetical protein
MSQRIIFFFLFIGLPFCIRCQSTKTVPDSIVSSAQRLISDLSQADVQKKYVITELIKDSLFVECYADKTKGAVLTGDKIYTQFDMVFGNEFFSEIQSLDQDIEKLKKSFLLVGNEWYLSIGVQYQYSDQLFPGNEYSRLFKIEILPGGGTLKLVQCAG